MSIQPYRTGSTSSSNDSIQINTEKQKTGKQPSIHMEKNPETKSEVETNSGWLGAFFRALLSIGSDDVVENKKTSVTEKVSIPKHKNAGRAPKYIGAEIGDRFADYTKKEQYFIEELKYLVGLNSNQAMQWASYQYALKTGESLVLKIEELSGGQEVEDLKAKFKDIGLQQGNYFKREYLALDLMNALNSDDTNKIEELMNSLNSSNVQGVYSAYATMTETTGEKMFQGNSLTAGKREILGGRSNESLLQGILNNKKLSEEKKAEYLYKFIECAVHSDKVKDSNTTNDILRNKRALVGEALEYNNVFYIEEKVAKLFGFNQ